MALTNHILPDSPTNNFCTLNPLFPATVTYAEGNLKVSPLAYSESLGNFEIPTSGKWYFEGVITSTPQTGSDWDYFGIQDYTQADSDVNVFTASGKYWSGSTWTSLGSTWSQNDILGVAVDMDSSEISYYINGSQSGTTKSLNYTGKTLFPALRGNSSGTSVYVTNFGQDPTFGGAKSPSTTYTDANGIGAFYYQPPTGAKALCTANLPDFTPTVTGDVPQDYFKAVTYTGQTVGGAMTSLSGTTGTVNVGFQPDLVWFKARTAANYHALVDSVRGSTKVLTSNATVAQDTVDSGNGVVFNANGFTVDHSSDWNSLNSSGTDIVAWCWKAGGTAVTNTDGSVTSTVSANPDAGFSIVSWSGDGSNNKTLGHGLSKAPEFIVTKARNATTGWYVWADALAATKGLSLDATAYAASFTYGTWGTKTSTTIEAVSGTNGIANVNGSGINYIAYCWHSVDGFSKIGSYTGNGSADGPFVYTGFRPAWLLIKRTDALDNWLIQDSTRTPFNWTCNMLVANNSNQENTTEAESTYGRDYLSNGFKIRASHSSHNATNGTYIYAAFAEQPFKYANAR